MEDIITTNIISHSDMVIDHFGRKLSGRSVVFTFTSLNNRETAGLGWGGKFLLDSGYDVIAFKRAKDDWYQDIDDEAILAAARFCDDQSYDRRIGYGGSMGGYAAILFSSMLNMDTVLAFGPQYRIDQDFDTRWKSYADVINWRRRMEDSIGRECKYFIVYDALDQDCQQVSRIVDLIPGSNYFGVHLPHVGHSPAEFLLETGTLKDFSLSVIGEDRFSSLPSRSARKRSYTYLTNLSAHLLKHHKPRSALLCIDRAISLRPGWAPYHIKKSVILDNLGLIDDAILEAKASVHLDGNVMDITNYMNYLLTRKK